MRRRLLPTPTECVHSTRVGIKNVRATVVLLACGIHLTAAAIDHAFVSTILQTFDNDDDDDDDGDSATDGRTDGAE